MEYCNIKVENEQENFEEKEIECAMLGVNDELSLEMDPLSLEIDTKHIKKEQVEHDITDTIVCDSKMMNQSANCKQPVESIIPVKEGLKMEDEEQVFKGNVTTAIEVTQDKKISGGTRGNDMMKCFVCDKSFKNYLGFKSHVAIHTRRKDGKPFRCRYCNKTYLYATLLTKHMQDHMKKDKIEKSIFKCHYCNIIFRTPNHLTSHIQIHKRVPRGLGVDNNVSSLLF